MHEQSECEGRKQRDWGKSVAHRTLPCVASAVLSLRALGTSSVLRASGHLCQGLALGCGTLLGLPRERMEEPVALTPRGTALTPW